jgi:hypothetical protein
VQKEERLLRVFLAVYPAVRNGGEGEQRMGRCVRGYAVVLE